MFGVKVIFLKFPRLFSPTSSDQKNIIIMAKVYLFFTLLVFSYEHTLISPEYKWSYLIGKFICILGTIPVFKGLYKSPHNQYYIALLLLLVGLYCVHGEYYRSLYFFVILEVFLPIIIMLNVSRIVLFPFVSRYR